MQVIPHQNAIYRIQGPVVLVHELFCISLTISDELNIISTQMMIDSTQRKMNSHEESTNHLEKVQTWSSYALYTPDWSHLHCRIKAVLAHVIQVSACVLYDKFKE